MKWFLLYLVVVALVLMFNHGGNKDKAKMDKICEDRFGTKL